MRLSTFSVGDRSGIPFRQVSEGQRQFMRLVLPEQTTLFHRTALRVWVQASRSVVYSETSTVAKWGHAFFRARVIGLVRLNAKVIACDLKRNPEKVSVRWDWCFKEVPVFTILDWRCRLGYFLELYPWPVWSWHVLSNSWVVRRLYRERRCF